MAMAMASTDNLMTFTKHNGLGLASSPEREQAIERIRVLITEAPDGAEVTWELLEQATSIRMDARGRGLVRLAVKRAGRHYETIRAVGFRLSSHETALAIIGSKVRTVASAVKKAQVAHHHLSARHLEQMAEGDKQKMIMAGSFLGAIRSTAGECATRLVHVKKLPSGG